MNTQTLEYIIAIAEEKSISRAADRLLVSQPAISRQLKRVEERLGTKLFLRERGEMILTDAGKIYVNGARSVQSIYEHALEEIRKLEQSGKRQITFIYNNALLPDFSVDILSEFRKLHPNTRISTIDGNASIAKDYLSNGMADLAVIATRQATRCSSSCLSEMKNSCLPCPPLTPQSPHLRNMGLISPCFEMSPLS